ncbi:GntR family transcriptional regulator [Streptomyces zaomyceticus]|uniref:GntR family transcriptional regulator n=1 Tax=Streptomyces zaomyceticus TaxID=68286 RepID=UPI0037232D65
MTTPLYRRVADILRSEIAAGIYAPGTDLPSERELRERFDASRNTIRQGLQTLVAEGLVISSQGRPYQVRKHDVFTLNASRFENLQWTTAEDGDSYDNEVLQAGRRPHQTFRVQMVPAPAEIAARLWIEPGDTTVLRYCHRFVDDTPWSTQATYYPKWLVDERPRLAEPNDIEEGTTRYLADRDVVQVGMVDEWESRPPTPEESRELQIGAGVSVLVWTRTGYTAERPVRCTISTFRGDLNRIKYEIGDLSALEQKDVH